MICLRSLHTYDQLFLCITAPLFLIFKIGLKKYLPKEVSYNYDRKNPETMWITATCFLKYVNEAPGA